jgi:signal transduction histidine kinase
VDPDVAAPGRFRPHRVRSVDSALERHGNEFRDAGGATYAQRVVAPRDPVFEPEHWGEDPRLVELLGERGAAQFRALFDGFPEAVGVLWAVRDADGRIVDFSFGYGNPSILRAFRLPAATRDRYTLLEALPAMRGSRAFDAYVKVCDSGEPWVHEVTYDTPFGDGYMLGTWVQRTAKLGDGLVNFLTDVTAQRRMEADLRRYADVVAHDLSEPVAGIALLVRMLERHAEEPPSADVLRQLRASTERARDLIDGVLVYAQAGELRTEPVALGRLMAEAAEDLRPSLEGAGATLEIGELPEVEGDPRQAAARLPEPRRQRSEVPGRRAASRGGIGPAGHPGVGGDGA